jgi:hypothetical protein
MIEPENVFDTRMAVVFEIAKIPEIPAIENGVVRMRCGRPR